MDGEATQGTPAGEAPAEGQQVDTSAVMERMDQLGQELGGIKGLLTAPPEPQYSDYPQDPYGGQGFPQDPYAGQPQPQFPQYGQPGQQGLPDSYQGQQFGQPMPAQTFALDPANVYDDNGNVNPQAATAYLQQVQQMAVNPAVQQAVAPIMQELEQLRFERGSDRLEQTYPELTSEETDPQGKTAADRLVERVMQVAPTLGMDPRKAVKNDGLMELVHQSMQRERIAAGERPARDQEAFELESGGGAGPAGSPPSFSDQLKDLRAGDGANQAAASFWGATGI